MAKRNKGINIFQRVPSANLPKTEFNMSHTVKFSGDFGVAYPFVMQDVIAGDTWTSACDHFARLAPMVAPILHNLDVRMHWFFVPKRLLWDDYEDWVTGGRTGTWREENPDAFPTFGLNDSNYIVNAADSDDYLGSIFDFAGLNFATDFRQAEPYNAAQMAGGDRKYNVLPIRAVWLIWNYFFRDQNVMEELEIPKTSGPDNLDWLLPANHVKGCFKVAWDKDYFTSATLTPQRGPQVYIPLGQSAPIVSRTNAQLLENTTMQNGGAGLSAPVGTGVTDLQFIPNGSSGAGSLGQNLGGGQKTAVQISGQNFQLNTQQLANNLSADLSSVDGAAVDDVREAFALQRFFERMQIVGSRFSEWLRGIFGTNAGDARLQMPEYLGTWQNPFIINNVSQTSSTDGTSPQGGYSGNGLSTQFNKQIVKNFPEPGYLIAFYVALPRNGYQQGLSKLLTRIDWLDEFNPYFEHIGEQPIMTSELYHEPQMPMAQDEIFGYQSQYASYKFINSHVHGDMKKSLDFWHCNREFSSRPTLSSEFIEFDPTEATNRIFALPNEPKFYVELNMKMKADRPMTPFSTPKLI